MKNNRIIITSGEPAGIGPDLIVRIAQKSWPVELVVCSDPNVLMERAEKIKLPLRLHNYQKTGPICPRPSGELSILSIYTKDLVSIGNLNKKNSTYVIETIRRSCIGCLKREFSAMITGPVHKGIINDMNISFTGHTEYLSKISKVKYTVMLLVSKIMKVALVTNHIPVSEISKTITKELLYQKIILLFKELQNKFFIKKPCIYVCGLNPHSGEYGHIGKEEIKIIIPTLENLRKQGYNLVGPLSADTIFHKKNLNQADAILTMYHDQGLPIIKSDEHFPVNITLGLPFLRTSVGHGTALELAGTKLVDTNSMEMALNLTINMIKKINE